MPSSDRIETDRSIADRHLADIVHAVWGSLATVDGAIAEFTYLPVPGRASAHQLLPWSPLAAVAAAGRPSDDRSPLRRLRDGAGVTALLLNGLVRADRRVTIGSANAPIAETLSRLTGRPVHSLVVLCGPPRANQKPVVQALDRFGRTLAFAKLAWNPLTADLLAAEHEALSTLSRADLGPVVVPKVLGRGVSDGVEWLALSPVHSRHGGRGAVLNAIDAAAAIETCCGISTMRLDDTAFARSLAPRATGLPLAEPAVERFLGEFGGHAVLVGAWHGDFVPWNMDSGRGRIAVWDWERFATGVPVGFDRLHLHLQVDVHRRSVPIPAALSALDAHLGTLLPGLDAQTGRVVLAAYLTELLVRYEHDGLGAESSALDAWCRALAAALDSRQVRL